MKLNENKLCFMSLISIVLSITLARIIAPPFLGHPSNFSPIGAIALFSGAYFCNKKYLPFLITFLSIWVSDIFINRIYLGHWMVSYAGFYWQYFCWMLITIMGFGLGNKVTALRVATAGLSSAVVFFIISNFGCWVAGWYPPNLAGLTACYIAAIPFFKQTLLSNLFYCAVLFGSYELLRKRIFKYCSV